MIDPAGASNDHTFGLKLGPDTVTAAGARGNGVVGHSSRGTGKGVTSLPR